MTALRDPFSDDAFTVTDAEVKAGRGSPDLGDRLRAIRDREITLVLGLGLLAVGFGMAWPPLGLIVPGLIVTAVALWARPGGAS